MQSLENRIEIVNIKKDYGKFKLGISNNNNNSRHSYLIENYSGSKEFVVIRTLVADPYKKYRDPTKIYYKGIVPSKFVTENICDNLCNIFSDWQNLYCFIGVMYGYEKDELAPLDVIKKVYDPGMFKAYVYLQKKERRATSTLSEALMSANFIMVK